MACEDLKWSKDIQYKAGNAGYIPNESGVYKIYVKLKNGKLNGIYIGKAKNLKNRFLQHLRDNETNSCIKSNL
ncbi:MAG: GIY-YIG nuclease family protein, partial [Candidatus Aenigmarchaeota archaeon]|nr:GIY-YIG nuclease family protein [Candidatus Aenigmarchaeota archaeon]